MCEESIKNELRLDNDGLFEGFVAETSCDNVDKKESLRIAYFTKEGYCGDIIFTDDELFDIVNNMLPNGKVLEIKTQ